MLKQSFLLLFIATSSWLFGQEQQNATENSISLEMDSENLFIKKIERTKSNTVLYLRYNSLYSDESICIGENTYIKDCNTNIRYKLVKTEKLPICPNNYTFSDNPQSLEFSLVFPKLPKKTTKIDLIEDNNNQGISLKDIDINQLITEEKELARFKNKFDKSNDRNEKHILIVDLAALYSNWDMSDDFPERIKEIIGETEYYAYALLLHGHHLREAQRYGECLIVDKKAAEINKSICGENSIEYAWSLYSLSLDYLYISMNITQNYQKSIDLLISVKKIYNDNNIEADLIYANTLEWLGAAYHESEEYENAIPIYSELKQTNETLFGSKSLELAKTLQSIAGNYAALRNHKEAIANFEEAIKIYDQLNSGSGHELLAAMAHSFLGLEYSEIGLYESSITELKKSISFFEPLKKEKPAEYGMLLNNLGKTYTHLGELVKSMNLFIEAEKHIKSSIGIKNKSYQTTLSNIALTHYFMGDLNKSENIYLELLEIIKETENKELTYALVLNNLSLIYVENGLYDKALQNYYICDSIYKEILDTDNDQYALNLANIAHLEANLGNHSTAENYINKAQKIMDEAIGKSNSYYISLLPIKAHVYSEAKQYKEAIESLEEANSIISKTKIGHIFDNTRNLINIASAYSNLGDYKQSNQYYAYSVSTLKNTMIRNFSEMSEEERSNFWQKLPELDDVYKNEYYTIDNGCPSSFDLALFSKGLLLNTSIELHKLLEESNDPKVVSLFENLRLLNIEIDKQYEKELSERTLNVDSLQEEAKKTERSLLNESKVYGNFTQNLTIGWQDVKAKLGKQDVAIEFVNFYINEDSTMYAALVLRNDWKAPKMVPLGLEADIQKLYKQKPDVVYGNEVGIKLSELIWKPLFKHVMQGDNVYFSPSGILYQLALEYLPIDESTIISQRNNLFRLSTTKQLCSEQKPTNINSAVLYGGLIYDMDEKNMLAQSEAYNKEKLFASNVFLSDTNLRAGWNYLASTKTEVEHISNLLKKNAITVNLFEGENGNEESFKNLSGEKTQLIHIATHGFFLPKEQARKKDFFSTLNSDLPVADNSLLRSGLLMSGSNKAWQGENIPEKVEDGVLTAKEISNIDLRGTSLLVLSACETGLGEITTEGVFGLQRAFKKAGVQTIIMSLWKVDDNATQLMMTEFYTNLLNGLDKRSAFIQAQSKIKQTYKNPFYWAGFIMLD